MPGRRTDSISSAISSGHGRSARRRSKPGHGCMPGPGRNGSSRQILGERSGTPRCCDGTEALAVVGRQARRTRPRKAACAFSSIASNTGARSPGEELMTCNTSAVAVCCSSASRVSVISRAFSIAITACAAKFCNSAICLSENGRDLLAINGQSHRAARLSLRSGYRDQCGSRRRESTDGPGDPECRSRLIGVRIDGSAARELTVPSRLRPATVAAHRRIIREAGADMSATARERCAPTTGTHRHRRSKETECGSHKPYSPFRASHRTPARGRRARN